METKENKEECLSKEIGEIMSKVYHYITDTPDWIYYFIFNEKIRDFVDNHPSWRDNMNFLVDGIKGAGVVYVSIYTDDFEIHTEASLHSFRDTVKSNYEMARQSVKDYRIAKLEEEIEFAKGLLSKKTEELRRLKDE